MAEIKCLEIVRIIGIGKAPLYEHVCPSLAQSVRGILFYFGVKVLYGNFFVNICFIFLFIFSPRVLRYTVVLLKIVLYFSLRPVRMSVCLIVSLICLLSFCLFVNLSNCKFACLSIFLIVNLSVCQFVCLSICLFVNLSVCQFV